MIRVANAPCSWGALEFGLEGEIAGWQQVLDEIQSTGYVGTELGDWGFLPTDPAALSAELAARRLALVGAFVPVALAHREAHAAGRTAALKVARQLAQVGGEHALLVLADDNGTVPERTQNAGRVRPELSLNEQQWATFAQGAEEIARAVRAETGLRTVFHHHCGGYVEAPWEIDRLMALTDPSLLGLCLDTGHALYGGSDPLALLTRYRERVWHVHLKDLEPALAALAGAEGWDYFQAVSRGVFCELGRGAVPFGAIVRSLQDTGYDGWAVVEQDVLPSLGTPAASARRNRVYLREVGLV